MNNRIKNAYFWLGMVSVVFGSANIDFETLTSWKLLFEAILSILNNPVAIFWVAGGILGVYCDNTTPGFRDK